MKMINNWNANDKMKKILGYIITDLTDEEVKFKIQQFNELLFPSFKKVKDCIIITKKNVHELEKEFENMIKVYGDRTGYEASNTETRIHCYLENEISMETGIRIALDITEIWALQLKKLEFNSRFCFIICADEDFVELRFHKVRSDEEPWLSEEIHDYDEFVAYCIL